MGTEGTRQHTVPWAYLRRFAVDPWVPEPQVQVLDLDQARAPFTTNISKVAVERGFFDLDRGRTYDARITEIETATLASFEHLCEHRDVAALSQSDRGHVAKFVLSLRHRGQDQRQGVMDMRLLIRDVLLANAEGQSVSPQFREFLGPPDRVETMDDVLVHAGTHESMLAYAPEIARRPWLLVQPADDAPEFMTSDNPVVLDNDHAPKHHGIGLMTEGTALILALSPTLALVILDPRTTPEGAIARRGGRPLPVHFGFVDGYHGRLTLHAHRFLFSRSTPWTRSAWRAARAQPRMTVA